MSSTLSRRACVHVPALPLQLLLRRHPEWSDRPVAVVDRDRPQGTVRWVNDRARKARVLPGLRYAAALSLCGELHAGEVDGAEVGMAVEDLAEELRRFTPGVEPREAEPGVFWLDASGLERLEPSLAAWARRIRAALEEGGFASRIAVGFTRFGTYAAARAVRGSVVLEDPEEEREVARRVRLDRLHLDSEVREGLAKLGVHTVREFLELPRDGLGRRFGTEAVRLHRLAAGDLAVPLDPRWPAEPLEVGDELDHPETDVLRLAFLVKRLLHPLLSRLADSGEGLVELVVTLTLDDGGERAEGIRPAEATLEVPLLLELVRLRLETLDLSAGVVEVGLVARGEPVDSEQLALFAETPRRDLAAAERALARIRAEFGDDAVVRAEPRERHLPEGAFIWEPCEEIEPPSPREVERRPLVRRLYRKPRTLPARGRREPDGWLVAGLERGPATRRLGPYVISGGWWVREVHREYHFVETRRGDVLWIYHDRRRRRWFLQGRVE